MTGRDSAVGELAGEPQHYRSQDINYNVVAFNAHTAFLKKTNFGIVSHSGDGHYVTSSLPRDSVE